MSKCEKQLTGVLESEINLTGQLNNTLTTIQGHIIEAGTDGVGLEFDWDETRLGIKREDEDEFIYIDLALNLTQDQLFDLLGYKPVKKEELDTKIDSAFTISDTAPEDKRKFWIKI